MYKRFLIFGGISGAIAVSLGAMAAHYLKSQLQNGLLTENNIQAFETAVKYHMYHSIVLLVLAFLSTVTESKNLIKAGYCFITGIILFSGSLYFLSTSTLMGLSNLKFLGLVTPVGGLFFIAGWTFIAFSFSKKQQ